MLPEREYRGHKIQLMLMDRNTGQVAIQDGEELWENLTIQQYLEPLTLQALYEMAQVTINNKIRLRASVAAPGAVEGLANVIRLY